MHKERGGNEDQSTVQRGKKNGFWNGVRSIWRLFREGRYRVKAEKREADNGRAGDNRNQMRILTDKRLQRPDGPDPFAFVQPLHHEENKHHDDRHLHQDKQGIEVRHQVNAFQIGRGKDRHKQHYPNPWRNPRE